MKDKIINYLSMVKEAKSELIDIEKFLTKLEDACLTLPNDSDLGGQIRKIFNEYGGKN